MDFNIVLTAFLFFAVNFLIFSLLIAGVTAIFLKASDRYGIILVFTGLLLGKFLADSMILLPVLKHYRKKHLIRHILPAELIYFMYVSFVGIGGQFLSFSWKGRRARAGRFENTPDGPA
jgi:hypothetical protein